MIGAGEGSWRCGEAEPSVNSIIISNITDTGLH